jgi:hypothetical protein
MHVHFKKFPDIQLSVSQVLIANVFVAFEFFMKQYKFDHERLHDSTWTVYEKKSELDVAVLNVFSNQRRAVDAIGEMQLELCRYYRLVRNATLHFDSAGKVEEQFLKVKMFKEEATRKYQTIKSAPNPPAHLKRDDYQLCIRVAQDVAWELSKAARPTDSRLIGVLKTECEPLRKRIQEHAKLDAAIRRYVEQTYGFDREEAAIIARQIL